MSHADIDTICGQIIRHYFPNVPKSAGKKLLHLAKEKGVPFLHPDLEKTLTNILGSIMRHEHTLYEMGLQNGISRKSCRDFCREHSRELVDRCR